MLPILTLINYYFYPLTLDEYFLKQQLEEPPLYLFLENLLLFNSFYLFILNFLIILMPAVKFKIRNFWLQYMHTNH